MTKEENNNLKKVEKLANSEVLLSFVVPAKEFDKFLGKAVEDVSKDARIDGFRPGKAPKDMVEKAVGSEKILYEGAERAIKKIYVDAILDEKIEAIGEPKIDIKKIAKGDDFEFVATVGVMPEIKIKDWEKAAKKVNKEFADKKNEVEEKEVDREINFLANQRAKIVTVNREAKDKDQIELDFEVFQDNVAIENGSAKKQQIIIGEGRFIPGFEGNLLGMKAGNEKEFKLEFPKKYHAEYLAGKEATFKVKVSLVQERQVPEINDEFAKEIGKFKTLEELRNNIKEGLEHEQKHKNEEQQKNKLIEDILKGVEIEVPDVLIGREIEAMLSELQQDLGRMGMTMEQYFAQIKKTPEELKKQWKSKEAVNRVKAALTLRQLAKENKIEAESKEIEERVNQILQYYGTVQNVKEKIDMQRLYESVKGSITNEKVFDHLMKL